MTYSLQFHPDAMKEWSKLDQSVKVQFKKKLAERLIEPHVPSARVRGGHALYKIKLAATGYRLIYRVMDDVVVVLVLAIGKREGNLAYQKALLRDR